MRQAISVKDFRWNGSVANGEHYEDALRRAAKGLGKVLLSFMRGIGLVVFEILWVLPGLIYVAFLAISS
jgi:hypothetical protein